MTDQTTPAKARLTDGLGPLPEPWIAGGVLHAPIEGAYTACQMREYAAREVAAERERLARMVAGERFKDGKHDARRGPGGVGTWHESSPMGHTMRELARVILGLTLQTWRVT